MFDTFDGGTIQLYGLPSSSHPSSSSSSSLPSLSSAYLLLKALLMACNLLLVIFSIVLLALGSYALSSSINALSGVTLPAGLICLGVLILLLALVAAVSVWRESRLGLAVYLLVLLCLVLSLFSVSVAVVVQKDSASAYITRGWQLSPPDVRQALEVEFACCGLTAFPSNASSDCPPSLLVTIPANATCLPLLTAVFSANYVQAGGCGIAFALVMAFIAGLVAALLQGIARRRAEVERERERTAKLEDIAAEGQAGGQAALEQLQQEDEEDDNEDQDEEESEGLNGGDDEEDEEEEGAP